MEVALVVAGLPPVDLLVEERCGRYEVIGSEEVRITLLDKGRDVWLVALRGD